MAKRSRENINSSENNDSTQDPMMPLQPSDDDFVNPPDANRKILKELRSKSVKNVDLPPSKGISKRKKDDEEKSKPSKKARTEEEMSEEDSSEDKQSEEDKLGLRVSPVGLVRLLKQLNLVRVDIVHKMGFGSPPFRPIHVFLPLFVANKLFQIKMSIKHIHTEHSHNCIFRSSFENKMSIQCTLNMFNII